MKPEKGKLKLFSNYTPVYYWNRDSEKPIRINQGGSGSSKTFSILQVIVKMLLERRGVDRRKPFVASVVCNSMKSLERGALRDFKTLIEDSELLRNALIDPSLVRGPYRFKNLSELEFFTVKDLGSAKSGKRGILFLNEVNSLNKTLCEQLMLRSDLTFIDYNSDAHFWVHKELLPRDDVDFFVSNFTHNKHISPATLKTIKNYFEKWKETGLDSWKNKFYVYGLGKTGVPEGAIYQNIEFVRILPKDMTHRAYFLDWGFVTDPLAFGVAGVYNRKIYAKELIYSTGITSSDLIGDNNKPGMFRRLGINRNDLIICDNSNPDGNAQLRRKGYNIAVFTDKRNKSAGIKALEQRDICITYDSRNWILEQQNYKWRQGPDGEFMNEPIDGHDHLFDGLLYWYRYHFPIQPGMKKGRKQMTRRIHRIN